MTFMGALGYGRKMLEEAGILDFGIDAWYLLEYACKIDRGYYYLHCQEEMGEEVFHTYQLLLKKRREHVPLQYITGTQEFMGLEFKVNSHVLIPRQDTETLVEEALKILEPGMAVLDLCTGSGCIAISLVKCAGVKICAAASDISKQALLVAKENAKRHQADITFIRSDLFQGIRGAFDLVISNPPYIPTGAIPTLMPEVKDFEPIEALDGEGDGLSFYRRIARQAPQFLNPNGYLYFEVGHGQGKHVAFLMEENGFRNIRVIKDLAGHGRVVCGNLPAVV
ncbi:MAG: peptide chain release factor N(5)-glutamine methyltransferase [Lachnospiraceae bacterium]|nr:peptide chain release factor N(5)-glutamine methyltransferase [Lachnospiraceae bacterium]